MNFDRSFWVVAQRWLGGCAVELRREILEESNEEVSARSDPVGGGDCNLSW